jgi:hypothetical protein
VQVGLGARGLVLADVCRHRSVAAQRQAAMDASTSSMGAEQEVRLSRRTGAAYGLVSHRAGGPLHCASPLPTRAAFPLMLCTFQPQVIIEQKGSVAFVTLNRCVQDKVAAWSQT